MHGVHVLQVPDSNLHCSACCDLQNLNLGLARREHHHVLNFNQ